MFFKWRTPEDYATNASIVLLAMSGLTIIMIDHETKSRQKRLALALTKGFWKFTPKQVNDTKQKKLLWMRMFLAGIMIACTALTISIKYLKIMKAVVMSVTILLGWATFLAYALDDKEYCSEEKRRKRSKINSENSEGWQNKLRNIPDGDSIGMEGVEERSSDDRRLPVTIVTGFLGSGKTTLVKNVLENTMGIKVLVIENEIGAEGIDHELLLQHTEKEEIILMNNGCICCTVRKDLITTFHTMFRDPSFSKLDWVLIETTGLADPGPLIQTLYMDKDCSKYLRLDSVLTVVDVKHFPLHMKNKNNANINDKNTDSSMITANDKKDNGSNNSNDNNNNKSSSTNSNTNSNNTNNINKNNNNLKNGVHGGLPEAIQQIIFSDRIILNKIDLIPEEELIKIKETVRTFNPTAPIICCKYANVPVEELLNIRAFDPTRNVALISDNERTGTTLERTERIDVNESDSGNKENNDSDKSGINVINKSKNKKGIINYDENGKIITSKTRTKANNSINDDINSVSTLSLVTYKPLDLDIFNLWISSLLRINGSNIYRLKGILNMSGYDNQFVAQGVHMIFDGEVGGKWNDSNPISNPISIASSTEKSVAKGRRSRLVLIGVGLDRAALTAGFMSCEHDEREEEM